MTSTVAGDMCVHVINTKPPPVTHQEDRSTCPCIQPPPPRRCHGHTAEGPNSDMARDGTGLGARRDDSAQEAVGVEAVVLVALVGRMLLEGAGGMGRRWMASRRFHGSSESSARLARSRRVAVQSVVRWEWRPRQRQRQRPKRRDVRRTKRTNDGCAG